MRKICACFLMTCALLTVKPQSRAPTRTTGRLAGYLLDVRNGVLPRQRAAQLIAKEMMSLAEWGHKPSPAKIEVLAAELAGALAGKRRAAPKRLERLANSIEYVLQSAGESTLKFRRKLAEARVILTASGVNAATAGTLVQQLQAIGEEVRGPEDTPLQAAS